jgi:hypothetical protein
MTDRLTARGTKTAKGTKGRARKKTKSQEEKEEPGREKQKQARLLAEPASLHLL